MNIGAEEIRNYLMKLYELYQKIYENRDLMQSSFKLDTDLVLAMDKKYNSRRKPSYTTQDLYNIHFIANRIKTENPKIFQDAFDDLNQKVNKELNRLQSKYGKFYYHHDHLARSMFSTEDVFVEDIYPMLIYISATGKKYDDVGLIIHENGNIEHFEGNEEITDETNDLINQMLGMGHVIVYAAHGETYVKQIQHEQKIPKGFYVSPDKEYASGYWSTEEQRVLFTAKIDMSYIRMESDVDWRVIKDAPIDNFKIMRYL